MSTPHSARGDVAALVEALPGVSDSEGRADETLLALAGHVDQRLDAMEQQIKLLLRRAEEQTSWLNGWTEGSDQRAAAAERQIELLWRQVRLLQLHHATAVGIPVRSEVRASIEHFASDEGQG